MLSFVCEVTVMGARSDWSLAYAIGSRPEWSDDAACYPDIAEWFWPVMKQGQNNVRLTEENKMALKVCASCRVQRECLERELAHPQPHARIAGGRVITARNEVV